MEPLEYRGGPFAMKVSRDHETVTLALTRGSVTLVELDLAASQIDALIQALKEVKP